MTEPAGDKKDDEKDGTLGQFLGCLALFIGLPAVIGGIIFLVIRLSGGGEALARMPLSTSPAETGLELKAETAVQIWAYVDVRHDGFSSMGGTEDLPHVVDYVIELRSAAAPASAPTSLRCNPFKTHIANRSGRHNSVGERAGRFYDGLIDGCALRLPAGTYTVRAWTEPVGAPDARFTFSKTELIVRAQ